MAAAPESTAANTPSATDLGFSSAGGAAVGAERTAVNYIDSAIPMSVVRFRFDAENDINRPDRGEFYYAKCGCFSNGNGPGPPLPEHEIRHDYEYSTYLEYAPAKWLSGFVEVPIRSIFPTDNASATDFSDMNVGFKAAFLYTDSTVLTFQMRTYIPTGNSKEGLGTNHVSLEPALLAYQSLGPRLLFEGELRDWIPIGGTDFESNVIRYGAGVSYLVYDSGKFRVLPVVEFVGWTFLGGKEASPDIDTPDTIKSASGDTIVNAKFGVRFGFGAATEPGIISHSEIAISYGRALTGEFLYKDIVRAEYRLRF
jgi:hypothetical protein